MAHEITPEQDNTFLELGRLLHEESYPREKKGFETMGLKLDIIKKGEKGLIVGEIKKSSRFLKSAKMQLVFYLYRLKIAGILASGELLIPKEKKRIKIELTPSLEMEITQAINKINEIISSPKPPFPQKIHFCRHCAYREFCWA